MNTTNLHELIRRYEENLDWTLNGECYEIMKWEAARCFSDTWFSDEARELPFSEMFKKACSETSIVINNSTISPTNGIVKMAEKEPETVKSLFNDVLFAEDGGDIALRQKHMDSFMAQIEELRLKLFPKYWKYQQDRHAVSCYMAFHAPAENYIYRYSDAQKFAECIEYPEQLGSGSWFSLPNYYKMCDMLVEAIKEHPSLLAKFDSLFNKKLVVNDNLHIMAFDLMYCCRCYNFYKGLTFVKKRVLSKQEEAEKAANARKHQREEQIAALTAEKEELEQELAETECVSLLGTQVTAPKYGAGIIVSQDENKVTVDFAGEKKSYVLHTKYVQCPTFEDNEDITRLMSERGDILDRLKNIGKELERLQGEK